MKCFSIFDVLKNLESISYTFDDNTSIDFGVNDFINYTRWKTKNVPTWNNNKLNFLSDIDSFNTLFTQFNLETKENFTRIKNALGLTYEVLDNYNGVTESTTTDTFANIDALSFVGRTDTTTLNHSDALTFSNRQDTRTLNHNDTLTFTNRKDTQTLNTTNTEQSDVNNPKTTTTRVNEHRTNTHYVSGYNSDSAVIDYKDVTQADATGDGANDTTIIESGVMTSSDSGTIEDAKTGTEQNTHSGTITDGKSGTETTTHSGTITDGKTGTEQTSHTGTITHQYEENKHGNLGVTTSQQMLESELELRLKYKLRPMIVHAFLDEYFYL